MSERDNISQVGCVLILAVFALVAMIVIVNKSVTEELRDLQRRVGQLESEGR